MSTISCPAFKHEPLPEGDFIRILHVQCSEPKAGPQCTFETISLSSQDHAYTAISYTWGDATPVRQLVCSDGQLLSLSSTLSDLFDVLVRKQRSFTIYVDALCIDQNDPVEKANQVRLIGNVYSRAEDVMVWLGPADERSQKAFFYMKEGLASDNEPPSSETPNTGANGMHITPNELNPSTQDVVDGLMRLLARRWFQRVWVIQEVILGTRILVACGDDTIDFATFESSIRWLWSTTEVLEYLDIRHPSHLGFRCATIMFGLKDDFTEDGPLDLESLFEAIFFFSATDSRDFVFAVQGIAASSDLLPDPDYTATIEDVFTKTAMNLLSTGACLDLLSMCGYGHTVQAISCLRFRGLPTSLISKTYSLPSWAPDFRQTAYAEPILSAYNGGWCAGGAFQPPPDRTSIGLHTNVIILDIVTQIGEVIATLDFKHLKSSLESAQNVIGKRTRPTSPEQTFDTVWKTLAMDLDTEDYPATPELGRHYHDLIQTLSNDSSHNDLKDLAENEFYRVIRTRTDDWRTFLTRDGYYGVTWPIVEEGDYLCLIPGCRFPLIVRPVTRESESHTGLNLGVLIGWCYVHDIMHGEENNKSTLDTLVLI